MKKNDLSSITTNKEGSETKENEQFSIQMMKHVFPFMYDPKTNIEEEIRSNEEFNNVVSDIIEKEKAEYLQGDQNIIEMFICKYSQVNQKELNVIKSLTMNNLPQGFGMLNDIGFRLPQLIELNLSHSQIKCISEIGISYDNLTTLIIQHCGLNDLSGLICFQKINFLDVSFNELRDLFELEMCSEITILKVNNNQIDKEENIGFIKQLTNLKELHIGNNPITHLIKDEFLNIKYII